MTKKTDMPTKTKKLVRTNVFLDPEIKKYLSQVSRNVSKNKGSRVTSAEVLRAILLGVKQSCVKFETELSAAAITARVVIMSPDSAEDERSKSTTPAVTRGGKKWTTKAIGSTYAEVIKQMEKKQEVLILRFVNTTFRGDPSLSEDIVKCRRVDGSTVTFYEAVWANDGVKHLLRGTYGNLDRDLLDGPEENVVNWLLELGEKSVIFLKQLDNIMTVATMSF